MSTLLIVVDTLEDWSPYFPSGDVVTFDQYLELPSPKNRVQVINLCRSNRYLSQGYYCSLLAEARQHHILPSLRVINDLSRRSLYQLELSHISTKLPGLKPDTEHKRFTCRSFFGEVENQGLQPLARDLFERFPCPALEIELHLHADVWQLRKLRLLGLNEIEDDQEQDRFAEALNQFSHKVWRKPKQRKQARYDLAILVDEQEKMPPSDARALKKFIKAGAKLGIEAELIGRRDLMRLPEYDGLFIRTTTAIDDYTYRFAKKAEAEGMVVIDDPTSILRCCNKIYLADLLRRHKIPAPKTEILSSNDTAHLTAVAEKLGFPMVLKIPDGSFSRGMVKVENLAELKHHTRDLRKQSALVLAQEFFYTEFDWRIGVLNHKPIYACRYYMVKGHWQIYNHGGSAVKSGGFETLPTFEVPKAVLQLATKASKLIGNGLYGIDIKQGADKAVVIEVNDNPSIESKVEDAYLGDELYMLIMDEFLSRMERRGREEKGS